MNNEQEHTQTSYHDFKFCAYYDFMIMLFRSLKANYYIQVLTSLFLHFNRPNNLIK